MRVAALCLITLASLASAAIAKTHTSPQSAAATHVAANQPPHAWLYGSWTGGLFPVLEGMAAQDCRTQPTVVFSKDVVGHATLLGTGLNQRNIATVRATPTGAEFTFVPDSTSTPGFGCETDDELHVTRNGLNEIDFPNCKAFPYPLERCTG
jgi:hypothetical protein